MRFVALLATLFICASALCVTQDDYHLSTKQTIPPINVENVGTAWAVNKSNFPALDGVSCFIVEVWQECMRIPHWHPNASELGYVVSGTIEIIIWRSPGETAVFTLGPGMCWFIPQGALHSLNNVGEERASLLVAFSTSSVQNIDLPEAFNGIPAPIRDAYTSPHKELQKWVGTDKNPLVGHCPVDPALKNMITGSPYGFDLAKVTPLFNDPALGSVIWGVKSNWNILQDISVLRAHLKPGVARDPIWYPDAGTLYVVSQGTAEFHLILEDQPPKPVQVKLYDYFYVPMGMLHTFINNSSADFEVLAFFTKVDPQPEVSLAVSTAFFPDYVSKAALTQYGNVNKPGDPLNGLKYRTVTPYLLKLTPQPTGTKN